METSKLRVATAQKKYHSPEVRKMFERITCEILEPWTGGISLPTHQKLDKCQRLGVRHAMERNHSYLAFAMGVGKTPTAIAIMSTFKEKTLVLCPPGLISMWEREIPKWSKQKLSIGVVHGVVDSRLRSMDIIICPDSIVGHPLISQPLGRLGARLLVVEEAQRFVNYEAQRTRALFGDLDLLPNGLVHNFDKVVFLSGTPMPNRPIELFPVLRACAANVINYRDKFDFGLRYCGAYEGAFGWDFKGESNTGELRKKMHGLFMRREETSTTGPKKTEEVIYFNMRKAPSIIKIEDVILKGRTISEYIEGIVNGKTEFERNQNLGDIAKYRSALGQKILPLATQWVENILKTTGESVLVLGWHQGPITQLASRLNQYHPAVIHGKTPFKERDKRLERFQKGKTRLLIGNIKVMVGHNIDKATRVILFEWSWVPSDNAQAIARAYRRTSTKNVLVQYLCLQNTLAEYVLQTNLKKQTVINKLITKQEKTPK